MDKMVNLADRLVFGLNLERPRSWRDDAVNVAEIDAWDAAERKKRGFFAGLRFFSKTNVPLNWSLASRHWPHKLCWDWSVHAGIVRPKWDGPMLRASLVISRKYRFVSVQLLFVKLHASWQNYGYMPNSGPDKQNAPKVIWGHHLEHMPTANDLAA